MDGAIEAVASNYNLECGGLPFTVCEFLDTACVCSAASLQCESGSEAGPETGGAQQGKMAADDGAGPGVQGEAGPEAGGQQGKMAGHKFEIRIVVYRDGGELKAFPSIAKVWGRDSGGRGASSCAAKAESSERRPRPSLRCGGGTGEGKDRSPMGYPLLV